MAVGWGTTSSGGSVSSSLRQVTMSTIAATASMCVSVLNDVTRQFCAGIQCGGRGEIVLKDSLIYCLRYLCVIDTCQGDSGGPIMIFTTSNQWVIVGVTSYGIGCAGASYAGVYTRIAYYQNWISSTMSAYSHSYINPASSGYTVSSVINGCITTTPSLIQTGTTTTVQNTTRTTTTVQSTTGTTRQTTTSATSGALGKYILGAGFSPFRILLLTLSILLVFV